MWSHHPDYLGWEDLFCTVLLCILATSSKYLLLLLGPYHFCPLLHPSFHLYMKYSLGISNFIEETSVTAAAAKSCPTLCDPIDGSPPGSPFPGILQARTLEWVAISFSNAWKWKVKGKSLSRVRILVTPWTAAYQAPLSMGFSRQEHWSGVPLPSPLVLARGPNPVDSTCVFNTSKQRVVPGIPRNPIKIIL